MPIRYVEGIKQARISIKTINPLEAIEKRKTTNNIFFIRFISNY